MLVNSQGGIINILMNNSYFMNSNSYFTNLIQTILISAREASTGTSLVSKITTRVVYNGNLENDEIEEEINRLYVGTS